MSDGTYHCKRPQRLSAIRDQVAINGLDHLEIANPAQTEIRVVFAHPLPGEAGEVPPGALPLTAQNFVVLGGERVRGIVVDSIAVSGREVTLSLNREGDFSTYRIRLVTDATQSDGPPPTGFDPWLADIAFSFKVECPSDFDCAFDAACATVPLAEPVQNYLAKDYESFRHLVLDRMALQMPDWRDRNAADLQIALVELLAYLGDQLSQYQDAVTPETYLMTSRLRRSVARHTRLLDYRLGQGLNARSWAHFAVTAASPADGALLPQGAALFTRLATTTAAAIPVAALETVQQEGPLVFETMAELTLNAAQNEMSLHTWSDDACCLPEGATRAWITNAPDRGLMAGDLVLFEEVASPETGLPQDADPTRRHVVRLTDVRSGRDELEAVDVVELIWHREDALPFPLCVSALVLAQDGTPQVVETGIARGNIVPADHGATHDGVSLDPPTRLSDQVYEPRLPRLPVVFREPYDDGAAQSRPAAGYFARDGAATLPALTLWDGAERWHPKADLLRSRRFDAHFVAEPERSGRVFLRFGNHRYGKAPAVGTTLAATVRRGGGPAGNIGADTLVHVLSDLDGIEAVRNPVPGTGGMAPESLNTAKAFAPNAYRTQKRAVIADDYARVAEEDPDVQQAIAEHFWFGSWYTVVVTVDGRNGRLVSEDDEFRQGLLDRLETRRMAGLDLQLRDPAFLNLDLRLQACAKANVFAADVKAALIRRFSAGLNEGGISGFFHPDNLTFGAPLFLSEILAAAMDVDGVASARIVHLHRWGQPDVDLTSGGKINPQRGEVLRLDNNPSLPEHGVLTFDVEGGL